MPQKILLLLSQCCLLMAIAQNGLVYRNVLFIWQRSKLAGEEMSDCRLVPTKYFFLIHMYLESTIQGCCLKFQKVSSTFQKYFKDSCVMNISRELCIVIVDDGRRENQGWPFCPMPYFLFWYPELWTFALYCEAVHCFLYKAAPLQPI